MLRINEENCIGCKICEKICPFGTIIVNQNDNKAKLLDRCTLCGSCVNACKYNAINIERAALSKEKLDEYSGIIIWGELENELENKKGALRLKNVVFELLGVAHELNKILKEKISVIIVTGNEKIQGIEELFHYGADTVFLCNNDLLKKHTTDGFTTALVSFIITEKPSIMFFGATVNGRDLLSRVAARLGLGLTADCTGFSIDEENQLIQTRPAFGGNIMASIITPYTRPQCATARPNNFPKPE